MKKTQRFLAGIFLLAVLLLGLMPVSTKAAALKATDPCYKITPQLTSASWKYIDEIYRQKYPDLGLTNWFLSDADREVLQNLSDTITQGALFPFPKSQRHRPVGQNKHHLRHHRLQFSNRRILQPQRRLQGYSMLMTALMRFAGISLWTAPDGSETCRKI